MGSSLTHYIWEGEQVIGEHDATTAYTTSPPYQEKSARQDYIYARGKMIQTRYRTSGTGSWTTRYYVSDVWSTRLVLDSSGNVLGRQGHLPFGTEFGESGTQEKHHFTSYEAETESGTDYAVNRQYSQSVGRFGSADPYQANSYLVNPQSWNRYSYVENDPIHNVDPLGLLASYSDGLDPCCTSGAGCGSEYPTPTEPAPKCSIGVSGRGSVTPGVPLQFPDGGRNRGFTTLSYDPMGLAPVRGWFWNIEVFASVRDDVANWTIHQEILGTLTGSYFENGVRKTDPQQLPFPTDEPTGARLVQYPGDTWLFWIDAPGLKFGEGIVPENAEVLLQGRSWITRGKTKCSVDWTLKLIWRNRRIDLSQSQFRSQRESW